MGGKGAACNHRSELFGNKFFQLVIYLSMRLDHSLDDLFRSRSHIRVLRALDELPDGLAVSVRDLARRSGLSHPTVSSALKSMLVQGVVLARKSARADAFEVNRQHVLVKKMRRLFEWERSARRQFLHFLQKQIESHGKAPPQ